MPITDTYLLIHATDEERVSTSLRASDEALSLTFIAGAAGQFTLKVGLKRQYGLEPWTNQHHIRSMIESLTLFAEGLKAHLEVLASADEEE